MKPVYLFCSRLTLALLLLSSICILSVRPAGAEGVFIPAPNRTDIVHDPIRNLLYITSGGEVQKYDLKSRRFLASFQLGGNLKGMDLSPDGSTLAVADYTYADGQNWIYLINLQDGTIQKKAFPLAFYEGGTYSVAYGNDGNILVTSTFNGSGWVPLRKYNPVTGETTVIRSSITQNTMLCGSADGGIIGFAESNISDGRWGRYRVSDGNFVERTGYTDGTSWYNYEIGTNRDGTQFAIPTYGGMFIYNATFTKVATIGQYAGPQPIGVVYHPTKNIFYSAWAETPEVRSYDSTTFSQIASYNFEYMFQHTGNWAYREGRLKISRNGALLFAMVDGGVRYVCLEPPVAYDQSVNTDEDVSLPISLKAEAPDGGPLTYQILSEPQHGTLSGEAPDLTYLPAANYNGPDSFTFKVNDGNKESNIATVSIDVTPVNDPPVARDDAAYTLFGKYVVIPVLVNDTDVDGDVLTVAAVSMPKYGSVKILSDGTLNYVPKSFPKPRVRPFVDLFTYTVSDGHGGMASAKVAVTVR
jgi:hypothetical protein